MMAGSISLALTQPQQGSGGGGSLSVMFGALTPAAMGDFPVTGAIASQKNSGGTTVAHFQVAGGQLQVTTAGAAATLSGAPYTLVMDTGQVVTITTIANAYSVGKTADFSGAGGVGLIAAATLAGKRIIGRPSLAIPASINSNVSTPLRRGMYGTVGTGWAGLVLESEDPTRPWHITDGVILTFRYVTFRNIAFTLGASNSSLITSTGTSSFPVSDIWFDGCQLVGTFRDPFANYSGNFSNVAMGTGDGATTTFAFTVPQAALWNGATNAVSIVAGAVTAVSGAAANTTLTGTGVASGSVNYATGAISVTYSAAPALGTPLVLAYLTTGVQAFGNGNAISTTSGGFVSNIRISGCTFMYPLRGALMSCTAPVDASAGNLCTDVLRLTGNYFEGAYENAIQIAYGGVNNAPIVEDNVIKGVSCLANDNANPHGDAVLFQANNGALTNWTPTIQRNITLQYGRGVPEPWGLRDFSQGGAQSGFNFVPTMIGNIVVSGSSEGINVLNANSAVILYNTIISHEVTDPTFGAVIVIAWPPPPTNPDVSSVGTHRLTGNVSEGINAGGVPTITNDVILGPNGVTIPYSACFANFALPTSRADTLARIAVKPGGPLDIGGPINLGATGGAVNWAAANPSSTPGSNNVS